MNFLYELMSATGSATAGAGKAGGLNTTALDSTMKTINTVVNAVVGGLGGVVLLYAIYLAYKFMSADSDEKRKNAKAQMIYAIIGVVVIFGVMILWNVMSPFLLGESKN